MPRGQNTSPPVVVALSLLGGLCLLAAEVYERGYDAAVRATQAARQVAADAESVTGTTDETVASE